MIKNEYIRAELNKLIKYLEDELDKKTLKHEEDEQNLEATKTELSVTNNILDGIKETLTPFSHFPVNVELELHRMKSTYEYGLPGLHRSLENLNRYAASSYSEMERLTKTISDIKSVLTDDED